MDIIRVARALDYCQDGYGEPLGIAARQAVFAAVDEPNATTWVRARSFHISPKHTLWAAVMHHTSEAGERAGMSTAPTGEQVLSAIEETAGITGEEQEHPFVHDI